jgi:hypothetical protein
MPRQIDVEVPPLPIIALRATSISERRYLQNVSPKTVEWYRNSSRAFHPYLSTVTNENELRNAFRTGVMEMAQSRDLAPVSISDYSRCLNPFMKWLREEGHITQTIRMTKLKEPEKVSESWRIVFGGPAEGDAATDCVRKGHAARLPD